MNTTLFFLGMVFSIRAFSMCNTVDAFGPQWWAYTIIGSIANMAIWTAIERQKGAAQ